MADWFTKADSNSDLQQGDLFLNLELPSIYSADTSTPDQIKDSIKLSWDKGSYIVLSQSCDLSTENSSKDMDIVTLAPVFDIESFLKVNPAYQNSSKLGEIRSNKIVGLHCISAPSAIYGKHQLLIAVFRRPYLVTIDALTTLSRSRGFKTRYRLKSPYVEAMSQRFGGIYSRVAIPGKFPNSDEKKSSNDALVSAQQERATT